MGVDFEPRGACNIVDFCTLNDMAKITNRNNDLIIVSVALLSMIDNSCSVRPSFFVFNFCSTLLLRHIFMQHDVLWKCVLHIYKYITVIEPRIDDAFCRYISQTIY